MKALPLLHKEASGRILRLMRIYAPSLTVSGGKRVVGYSLKKVGV